MSRFRGISATRAMQAGAKMAYFRPFLAPACIARVAEISRKTAILMGKFTSL